jgi:hypothetical protein
VAEPAGVEPDQPADSQQDPREQDRQPQYIKKERI